MALMEQRLELDGTANKIMMSNECTAQEDVYFSMKRSPITTLSSPFSVLPKTPCH